MKKLILIFTIIQTSLLAQKMDYNTFTNRALEQNPGFLQLESELSGAKAEAEKAQKNYFPTVDFTGSYTYQQHPMEAMYLNLSEFGTLLGDSSMDRVKIMDAGENNYFDFGLKVTQPIYTWGKISNGVKIYKGLEDLKYLEKDNLKNELETKIKIYYYTLAILNQSMEYIENQLKETTSLKDISTENYNNGFIEYSSLLEVEFGTLDLERGYQDLQYQVSSMLENLKYILGDSSLTMEDLDLNVNLDYTKFKPDISRTEVEEKIMKNPGIQQLNQLSKVRDLELKVAQGSKTLLPDLALQIDMGYSGSRVPLVETDWYRQDDYDLNFTFAITTTVFDAGISTKNSEIKKETLNSVKYQREDAINTLKQQSFDRLSKLKISQQKLENYSKRIELTQKKQELSQIKFNEGLILEADLISDNIDVYLDKLNFNQELLNYFVDYWTLENILGTWSENSIFN